MALTDFPAALQRLIEAELAAGNEITGTPSDEVIELKNLPTTPLPAGVDWKVKNLRGFEVEYFALGGRQIVRVEPWPPHVSPDMDAIREFMNRPHPSHGRDPIT